MTAAVLAAAVGVAAFVQAITGFGFALLAAPALVALLAPSQAVSTVALLGLLVNLMTLAGDGRAPDVLRRELLALLAWAAPGLPLGVLLLTRMSGDAVRVTVAVLVLVALAQRRLRAAAALPAPAAGLLSGALTTATGLNGPPLVLRLSGLDVAARARRHTLAALFLALGVLGVAALAAGGQLEPPSAFAGLAATAAAGALVGARAAGRIAGHVDERLVTTLLVAAALTAAATAL